MRLVLSLLFIAVSARAESTAEWLDRQWAMIPTYERAEKPSPHIPIGATDRQNLDLNTDPVARNAYITASYHTIAQELHRCLGADAANWYHYGNWASRNSGRYISGEHFDEMPRLQRWGLGLGGGLGVIPSQAEMRRYLVHTNFLIGVEMIPAGRHFINTFCQGRRPRHRLPYNAFGNLLGPRQEGLSRAFARYHTAIRSPENRQENVVHATTLHMFAEQTRAQNNVDLIFRLGNARRGAVEFLYRWIAAGSTAMELDQGFRIPFSRDVDATGMPVELVKPQTEAYRSLFVGAGLAMDPQGGVFRRSAVQDWGNLRQRLRFLAAMARAHSTRAELLRTYP